MSKSGEVLPAVAEPSSPNKAEVPATPPPAELTVPELVAQVELIQDAMRAVMREGEHYGRIPGTGSKPTLLKPGAEKLCLLFRLAPEYVEAGSVHKGDFIAYRIRCILRHIPTGNIAGEGMGSCNSKERKYAKAQAWDIDNTLLKMACKRALVAAVLVATAASDIFTQDLEDNSSGRGAAATEKKATKPQHAKLAALIARLEEDQSNTLTDERGDPQSWEDYSRSWARAQFGKQSRADLTAGEMSLLIEHMQDMAVPF